MCIAVFCLCVANGCGSPNEPNNPPTLGDRIVFLSDRHDANNDIYSMALDGSDVKRLTNDNLYTACPSVSPDGRWIAYFQASELMLMRADGSGKSDLGASGGGYPCPAWSRDSEMLVVIGAPEGSGYFYRIKVLRRDGTVVGEFDSNGVTAEFSHDGTHLLLSEYQSWPDPQEVTIVSLDGSSRRLVTYGYGPNWLPTGDSILYACDDGDPFRAGFYLCVINADGTGQRLFSTEGTAPPTFSPDGSKFAGLCDGGWLCVLSMDGTLLSKTSAQGCDSFIWAPDGGAFIGSCPIADPMIGRQGQRDICRVGVSVQPDVLNLTHNPAADVAPSMASPSQ